MNYQDTANIDVTAAFSANANYLPAVREEIKTLYPTHDWTGEEANVLALDLRSDSPFTVKLNRNTEVDAVSVGGVYIVQFAGVVEYIIFSASTTLTYFWVSYNAQHKDHNIPTFSGASGTVYTVKDGYGNVIAPTPDGTHELTYGRYTVLAEASGYEDAEFEMTYLLQDTIPVRQITPLDSVAVTTAPTKTAYTVGEALELDGIAVTATFENGDTADVTDGCSYTPENGAVLALTDTEITVSYTDEISGVTKTATTPITVTEPEPTE